MKWIKKILISFLVLLLVNLISILMLSFNLKKILVNGIIKETITTNIMKSTKKENNFIITEETINQITDDERIKELLNTKEVNDLLNKYLDLTIDSMLDESKLDEVEIEKDMLNFIEENKSTLENLIGQEITKEALDNTKIQMATGDWSKSYKQSVINASETMTKTEKQVLIGYNLLVSTNFRIIIMILIIIDLLLLAIIEKSWYKWIEKLLNAMITSGLLLIAMSIITQIIVRNTSEFPEFQMYNLLNTSIIIATIGIILKLPYNIIFKSKEKERENDIS